MPWKNGGGTTTELFRLPDPNGEEFLFRISIADVKSDGPFSFFPRVQRCLMILNGAGCILNDMTRLTDQSQPYFFSGEDQIYCKLINGSFQDFNLMIKKGWKKMSVERIRLASYEGKAETFIYLTESHQLIHFENEFAAFPEQLCIIVTLT